MAEPSAPEVPPESTPKAESSPSPEPEGSVTIAEPIPDWSQARAIWKWGWDVHWIGFAILFLLIAIYAAWSIWCANRDKKRRCRTMLIFISCLLFVFGLSRALFLLLNPYESPECHVLPKCEPIMSRLLYAAGLPSMTAAFSFIQLMFLNVIKLRLYSGRIQNWKFLLALVAVHFSLAYGVEIIVYFYADWRSLSIICQVFYIILSLVLSTSFMFTGHRIIHHVNQSAVRVSRFGSRTVGRPENALRRRRAKPHTPNIAKLVKIIYLTAFLGLFCCGLELYAIFCIYNMYQTKNAPKPEAVPWIVFQSLYRLLEILIGVTMAYVSPRQTKQWSHDLLSWLPCCHKCGNCFNAVEIAEDATTMSSGKAVTLDLQSMKEEHSDLAVDRAVR